MEVVDTLNEQTPTQVRAFENDIDFQDFETDQTKKFVSKTCRSKSKKRLASPSG